MATLLYTVDLGNSRCKLCAWRLDGEGAPARVVQRAVFDAARDAPESWLSQWRAAEDHEEARKLVALSSVAAEELEHRVSRTLARELGAQSVVTPDSGLEIRCRTPERVGRDRVFAARGAFEIAGRSALVIDVGTAMTVDALLVEPQARRPAFLGGAIAPGPSLLAEALARGTARLPLVEPRPGVEALGRDTQSALLSGIVHGVRGAARELVARISEETGLSGAPIVLTGGASSLLAEPALFDAPRVEVVDDLVHIGLLCAALAHGAGGDEATRRLGWWSRSA